MSIQIADTLYPTSAAAVAAATHSWLYANGLNDDAYVLATLQNVPHQDIVDEVIVWLEPADFDPRPDMILAELAAIQQILETAS
jgi:hypothetical protein